MEVRACKVSIRDAKGVAHTVQVTTASLYEAVALGLKALRANEWIDGLNQDTNNVSVAVQNIPVEHKVPLKEFRHWLDQRSGSPREVIRRKRIREILDLPPGSSG